MAISAKQVKELRERTGAGMMECKKALTETNGDIEAAVEHMRKTGLAKADKKAGRVAAQGALVVSTNEDSTIASILEVNCETDFVAMGDDFRTFSERLVDMVREEGITELEVLNRTAYQGDVTVDEQRRELVAKIGENIAIRRFETLRADEGVVGAYLHGQKIGVLVEISTKDEELARDLAMHIAASNPLALDADSLPQDAVDKEKEIHRAKAEQSGKPDNIVEKIVEGSMKKYFAEVTLLEQKFIKDTDKSIEQLLKESNATIKRYVRYELGEGIEKEEDDFVAEVMAQAKGQ